MSGLDGILSQTRNATSQAMMHLRATKSSLAADPSRGIVAAAPAPVQQQQQPPYWTYPQGGYPPPPYGQPYPVYVPMYYQPWGQQPYAPMPMPGYGAPPPGYYDPYGQQQGYNPYGQQQGYGGGFAPPYAQPVAYPSPYPQGMVPYGFMPWGPQPVMLVELANFYNPMFGQGYGGGGSQPINYMDLLALQGGNSQFVQQQMIQNALDEAYMAGAMETAYGYEQQLGMMMADFYQYAMWMDFQFGQLMTALMGPASGMPYDFLVPPQPAPNNPINLAPALGNMDLDPALAALFAQLLSDMDVNV